MNIQELGVTSAASTISYLDNAVVYVGSSYGDSQLVKLNGTPDANGSYVEVRHAGSGEPGAHLKDKDHGALRSPRLTF